MDPYKVLGLSPGASDDEIKKAYRNLAKKYHPDANPGDKSAEQKMKEVNAAYDMLINHRYDPSGASQSSSNPYGGGYANGDPFGGFGGFGGFDPFRGFYGDYSQQQSADDEPPRYRAAYNYIQYGRWREALNALSSIPASERTARWYYYAALAHSGLGDRVAALQNAERAVSMEPSNAQYRSLLSRLQSPGGAYTSYGRGYSVPTFNVGRYCLYICLFNILLRFCCCGSTRSGGGAICC